MEAARTFVVGHAVDADWETMVRSCLDQMQPLPERGNIGFIYVTDLLDDDLPLVVEWLREETGVQHWLGTVGFGVMVGGQEYFDVPAIVSMIGFLPDYSVISYPDHDNAWQEYLVACWRYNLFRGPVQADRHG